MRQKLWFRIVTTAGLIFLVLGTVIAGIVQVELDLNQFFYHKALAFTLVGVIVIHLVTNRKALAAYFRGGRPAGRRVGWSSGQTHQQATAAVSPATPSADKTQTSQPTIQQPGRWLGRRGLLGLRLGAGAGWAIGGAGVETGADPSGLSGDTLYEPSLRYHQESRLGLDGALREVSLRVFQTFQADPPPLYKRYPENIAVSLPAPSIRWNSTLWWIGSRAWRQGCIIIRWPNMPSPWSGPGGTARISPHGPWRRNFSPRPLWYLS